MVKKRMLFSVALVLMLAVTALVSPRATTPARSSTIGNKVIAQALAVERGQAKAPKWRAHLSSGVVYTALEASGALDGKIGAGGTQPRLPATQHTQGCSNAYPVGDLGATDVRVNQDCSYRRQAEEVIAVNPTNPQNLVAGQNDSRIGFNHCGYDFSFDGGKTWGDQLPQFWQFIQGDGHTADACSDPTAGFDSAGNVYAGGIVFDIASNANSVIVVKSNAPIGGAFYHSPLDQPFQVYRDSPVGVIASDNNASIFNDKEFLVADSHLTSPKANNVYMTWTRFNASTGNGVGGNSPIFFSQSTDGGATWSAGVRISGSNAAFCTDFSGSADPNSCDQDQGSFPVVGTDGSIYVSFFNGNTPGVGINQALFVKCPAAADCSSSSSWTAPVKVGDMIDNEPVGPDATTGCPSGRTCLPPNGYRIPEETSISLSADSNGRLYTVWADFRNGGAPCTGNAASATPPCNEDVFYSVSKDGGASWSLATNVTGQDGQTAQFEPGSSVTAQGGVLWIAYYDRSHGSCETTGCNDITLAKVSAPASASPSMTYSRLTSSSMPNLVPANNPVQAGFIGDYMWVAVGPTGTPYVVWADTRGLNGAVEEDVYFYHK